jgi:spore coat protein U-like protein
MNKTGLSSIFRRSAVAVALLSAAVNASALTTSATFQVTANVAAQCSVTAADLAFGTVNPLGGNVDQTSTINVRCTRNTAFTVGLNAGTVTGTTIADRLMANGTAVMRYQLYSDSTRATVWGNSSGSWIAGAGQGMGTPVPLTIYGRVPSGQTNLAVGNYAEPTITVTITY